MKSLRNIFYITMLGLAGASCSDDFQAPDVNTGDDVLMINVEVPEEVVVNTRAASSNEEAINSLGVYIFNSAGTSLLQYQALNTTAKTASIGLNAAAKGQAKTVYIVANASGISQNPASVAALEALSVNASNGAVPSGGSDYFVMSGSTSVGANDNIANVNITRLAAKVSVIASTFTNYTLSGFEVHNPADNALIGSPAKGTFGTNGTTSVVSTGVGDNNPVYVYPSESATGTDMDKAFVIIKAKNTKNNSDNFYRINLRDEIGNPLNIQPNHHIKIQITAINGDGYATAEEAAQHPELQGTAIVAEIHDHASGVFSMTSDGTRELGAPAEILWTAGNSHTFTVKWFSHNSSDMNTKPTVNLTNGSDWVQLSTGTNEQTSAESSSTADTDNPGHRLSFTLTTTGTTAPAWDTEAEIKVSWLGLERIVKVSYTAEFNPDEVLSSTKWSYGTTSWSTGLDYWTFLKSTLAGADETAMGEGMDRTNGFHFPMYHASGRNYKYDIVFNKDKFNGNITGITANVTGDNPLNNTNVKWTPNTDKVSGTLTFNYTTGTYQYEYATGVITFSVSYTDNTGKTLTANIDIPLYHTGFFWQHTGNTEISTGWYYYEVVPMAGTNNSQYWLDRNIGAKSRLNYVEVSSGTSPGKVAAKGAMLSIANPGDYKNVNSSPTLKTNICPDGFHIPTKAEFDAVRSSSNFITEQDNLDGVQVYSTFFKSPNGKAGKIYFPKGRFQNGSNTVGDDRSGYYWTCSESLGLEKDQIGKWLNVLYMTGGSNTWINGSIEKHKMPVRAVAGASAPVESKYTLGFNIKGATHVYIYDNTTGSGLFTFPGKAVCTYSTAKTNTTEINFSYTTSITPGNLRIYLVNVDDSGKVTVYGANDGGTSMATATGLPYTAGKTYSVSGSKTIVN